MPPSAPGPVSSWEGGCVRSSVRAFSLQTSTLLHRTGWLFLDEKATPPTDFYMQWKRNRYRPDTQRLMRGLARWLFVFAAAVCCSLPVYAHVGSPDVYA